MKLIELTHVIEPGMPVWPGTEHPTLTPGNTIERDHFRETILHMCSHTGTHMDAPAHLVADGATLDKMDIAQFAGRALCVDCEDVAPGTDIPLSILDSCRAEADKAEYLLFRTGWSKFWGTEAYYGAFPGLSEELARYIADAGKKGVGIDAISIEAFAHEHLAVHGILLSTNRTVIVENLTNLAPLCGKTFDFFAFPLRFLSSDGAPVRAAAMLPDVE